MRKLGGCHSSKLFSKGDQKVWSRTCVQHINTCCGSQNLDWQTSIANSTWRGSELLLILNVFQSDTVSAFTLDSDSVFNLGSRPKFEFESESNHECWMWSNSVSILLLTFQNLTLLSLFYHFLVWAAEPRIFQMSQQYILSKVWIHETSEDSLGVNRSVLGYRTTWHQHQPEIEREF